MATGCMIRDPGWLSWNGGSIMERRAADGIVVGLCRLLANHLLLTKFRTIRKNSQTLVTEALFY